MILAPLGKERICAHVESLETFDTTEVPGGGLNVPTGRLQTRQPESNFAGKEERIFCGNS